MNVAFEKDLLDPVNIPRHVAIIMDGNRRWAKKNHVSFLSAHKKGAEALMQLVETASSLGVKTLTVYAFSTENWKREKSEINSLMYLFDLYLKGQKNQMIEKGVRFSTIGDLSKFSQDLQKNIELVKEATAVGTKIDLVLAVNYGGRDDIKRALARIVDGCVEGSLKKEDISESLITAYLDTAAWEDPQLLIRTSGEKRLSNFLLWQISYAEIYVTDTLWPDFDRKEFIHALIDFQKREKRSGK